MATATYTKSGNKATATAKLDKSIFGIEVKNHELLKKAYVAYLANGRQNLAQTKTRGDVRGGGKKPWRQKGTGRARFGSTRNPIWRGGGVAFGPTGNETYAYKLQTSAKQQAIRQALSLASAENKLSVIETFESKDGKVKPVLALLAKLGVSGNVIFVVSKKDDLVQRATNNLQKVKVIQANYLSVYDIMNADMVIVSQKALPMISEWLGDKK